MTWRRFQLPGRENQRHEPERPTSRCRDRVHVWLLRIVGAFNTAPTALALKCQVEEPSHSITFRLMRRSKVDKNCCGIPMHGTPAD
jgi:hypothetical protein